MQCVGNLLVNASKFTPAGGRLRLHAVVDASTVIFRVQDNGIGLTQESLNRIFDLFAQAPAVGEASTGLGIGLSLARQFAEMHGGTLIAESDGLGSGSTFTLTLPVVMEANVKPPVRAPLPLRAEVQRSGRKVLVVDDNVDAADTLDALLGMDGFEVKTVYDGIAAVSAAALHQPDVVVMDIGMPGMNGYDAAQRIRQGSGGQAMVLIALTGWGQTTDKQRASHAGFDHHLVKPVDYSRLLACLQTKHPGA